MLKPDAIPYEVVEAYLEAVEHGCGVYEVLSRSLSAWPGMYRVSYGGDEPPFVCLPLPQEARDE